MCLTILCFWDKAVLALLEGMSRRRTNRSATPTMLSSLKAMRFRASDDSKIIRACFCCGLVHTETSFSPIPVGVRCALPKRNRKKTTQVGLKALYEIAKVKNAEIHSVLLPLESVCKSVRATALSMGLEIVDDRESLKQTDDDL